MFDLLEMVGWSRPRRTGGTWIDDALALWIAQGGTKASFKALEKKATRMAQGNVLYFRDEDGNKVSVTSRGHGEGVYPWTINAPGAKLKNVLTGKSAIRVSP